MERNKELKILNYLITVFEDLSKKNPRYKDNLVKLTRDRDNLVLNIRMEEQANGKNTIT